MYVNYRGGAAFLNTVSSNAPHNKCTRAATINPNLLPQASKYEHVDAEEHAYRKLEREYTNKTNKAAAGGGKGAAEGAKGGLGEVAAAAGSKKGRQGRWFD